MTTFIYQPRSGDRVFCERPGSALLVTLHPNGCRHVSGDFVVLRYDTAQPRRWWRSEAVQAIKLWAEANDTRRCTDALAPDDAGIVAWDDRGQIFAAVRRDRAASLAAWMREVASIADAGRDTCRAADVALLMGGIYLPVRDAGGAVAPGILRSAAPPEPVFLTFEKDAGRTVAEVHDGYRVPWTWGQPTHKGGCNVRVDDVTTEMGDAADLAD